MAASLAAISNELRARGSMPVGMVQTRFGVTKQTASKLLREGQSKRLWTVRQGAVLPMRMPKATLSAPRVRTTQNPVRKRRKAKVTKRAAPKRKAAKKRAAPKRVVKKATKRAAPKRKPASRKTASRSVGRAKTSRTRIGRKKMATAKQKAAARRNIKKAQAALRRKKAGRKPARRRTMAAPGRSMTRTLARGLKRKPKRRKTTSRGRAVSAIAVGKPRRVSRRRLKPGSYIRARTGRRVRVVKNPIGRNTRDLLLAGLGLGLGLVGASIVDRYVATMPPKGSTKALVGPAATSAIQAKPSNTRIAAQAIGTGAAGIGSYLLKRRSPTAAYLLGGVAVGFGVKLFQCVTDAVLMPTLLKASKPDEDTFANRIYPEFQTYGAKNGTVARPFAFRARGQMGEPQAPQVGPVASGNVGKCNCGKGPGSHPGLDKMFPGSSGCGPSMPHGCGQPGCGGFAPSAPIVVPEDEPVAGVPIEAIPRTFPEAQLVPPSYPEMQPTGSPLANLIRVSQGQPLVR